MRSHSFNNLLIVQACFDSFFILTGKCYNFKGTFSTARNSFARKLVFQANLQISLAVFKTCTADMLG
jgi:hypothetical protein